MVDNSKMQLFIGQMNRMNYSVVKTIPEEVYLLYKIKDNTAYIIINIDYHTEFVLNKEQLEKIRAKVKEIFLTADENTGLPGVNRRYYDDVETFTLIWSEQMTNTKELVHNSASCWLIDVMESRLIVYEHQREDFEGIRDIIEDILYDTNKSSGNNSGIFMNGFPGIMNIVIVLINVLVYIGLEWIGDTTDARFMLEHGAMYPPAILEYNQWYRIITSMFMHFGVSHLINNMVILFFLGDNLESMVGKVKYLMIYLISGITGSLLSLWYMTKTNDLAVGAGASGAVFGVIGALIYISIRTRGRYKDLSARRLILMACMSLYYGFTAVDVDNLAHIGGLAAGFIMAVLLFRKDVNRKD